VKDTQITSAEQLDAVIVGNAMSKREKLWRAAEGRSYLRFTIVAVILGAALIFGGLYMGFFGRDDVTFQVVIGMVLIGGSLYRSQQTQIDALRELLKLNERQST
jgi:hypothetical protein